ncbi:hypothetical protein A1Q1_01301 [Trichosporon asahii var. asahii CBS 2479]|uniref:Uncharacterized protein n=1 Tax=Trichosporon asahii var. asahii (strain ATCC 90039 / CBS 2479 / JCM 2466 / KCTC 7840 / NBRC 103889/ NCYC 2677 / UAMH 7654) TaxID=1186058 RepID=J6F2Y6_TRIAS|nr:hypothetical protein A1Q1_01301 [Trichosporon asahii var. asahii CBS 2479]EJT49557.1 hypothetical protein A1Q1_01301 [Trichosporon asahii var. asahii CBS 2479]
MPRIAAPPLNMTPSSSSSRDQFGHIQSTDQLHCELAACRSDERALAVLRGYIAPRSENKRACDKVLNEVEVKWRATRQPQLTPVPTTLEERAIRARGATPIRSATGATFPSDMLSPEARSNLRQAEATASRAPAGPGGLPPYSERDPDPASTMMLERRLASELNELGGLSGFCVESTDPDYLDGIRETRDENESRRFSAGEAGERRSPTVADRGEE